MRRFFLALAMVFGLAQVGQAQGASIEDVIGSQLDAFNDRDVNGAWQFASPMIQGMFGDADNFEVMVQRGYPMVFDNRDVRFLEQREIAGRLYQKVMLRDASGGLHILDYTMIETPDGWRIDGVQILPAPEAGS
ncbi:MAG: DUF4864 domain-containing protein [Octadecabacter sp.]